MHINLPDSLSEFVETQVAARGLNSPDEYVAELVEVERRNTLAYYEAEVLKGLTSGSSTPFAPEDWKAMREEVLRRHELRQQSTSE